MAAKKLKYFFRYAYCKVWIIVHKLHIK